jgi:hypothetical protein
VDKTDACSIELRALISAVLKFRVLLKENYRKCT